MDISDFEDAEKKLRIKRLKRLSSFQSLEDSLSQTQKVFKSLSNSIHLNGRLFSVMEEDGSMCILGTELIDSSAKTLGSIQSCLENGSLSDAYTLMRAFRDKSFMFIYFLAITKEHQNHIEERTKHTANIFSWYQDQIDFISIKVIFKFLSNDKNIDQILSEYNLQNKWETLRNKLNDHVHAKGKTNALSNYSPIYNYENGFREFEKDLKYIGVTFLSILLLVDSTIIMSTDYTDHLEMGLTPPEGSKYKINPRIQEFINDYLKNYNNELVDFIKEVSIMDIE